MSEPSSISNWIPVIGTLSGAAIGLLASFLIAYFNKSSDETDYRKIKLAEKQNTSGALYKMQNAIEVEIKSMQACLAKRVKA